MSKNIFKILGLLFVIVSLTACLIGCEKQEQPANNTAEIVAETTTEEIKEAKETEETLYIQGIIDEINEEYEGYFHVEIVGTEEK